VLGAQYMYDAYRIPLNDADKKIVQSIERWANDSNSPPVYWLNRSSPAENNKIARAIAEKIGAERLGASFFCSQVDTKETHLIFTTLSCQLAEKFPEFKHFMLKKLQLAEFKHRAPKLNVDIQLINIILEPCEFIETPTVIIIDALDISGVQGSLDTESHFFSALEREFCYGATSYVKFLITAPRQDYYLRTRFRDLAKARIAVICDAMEDS
jgi:hypothetical protein